MIGRISTIGKQKVADAELEAAYKPGAKNTYEVSVAKADANYAVANERCDDKDGTPCHGRDKASLLAPMCSRLLRMPGAVCLLAHITKRTRTFSRQRSGNRQKQSVYFVA